MKSDKIILKKIPIGIQIDDLRIFFESDLFNYINVLNIKEQYSNKFLKDVLVEFENEDIAKSIVKKSPIKYFDNNNNVILIKASMFYGKSKLTSNNFDSDTESLESEVSESSIDINLNKLKINSDNLNRKIFYAYDVIDLWPQLLKIVQFLNEKYSPDVQIRLESNKSKFKPIFEILSKSDQKLNQCFYELKSKTEIESKIVKLTNEEIAQVVKLKDELVSLIPDIYKDHYYFDINENETLYIIKLLKRGGENLKEQIEKLNERFTKFLDENLEKTQEYTITNPVYLQYFRLFYKPSNCLRLKFDNQKMIVTTKRGNMEEFSQINKNLITIERKVKINNKRIIPYFIFKTRDFIKELNSKLIYFKLKPLERNSDFYEFSIICPNQQTAEEEAEKIDFFIRNSKLKIVDFDDVEKAKIIEKKFVENSIQNCDVKYNDEKRKFYINGLDEKVISVIERHIINKISD